ncbi:general odorant-binding protein 99a [Bombyx mori]|uniref:general odorant-binding protein 99a n=1 Tax=Bombyx mori TaxID=7091 RepID=UPI00034F9168
MTSFMVFFVLSVLTLKYSDALTDEQKNKIQSKFIEIGAECIVEHPISIDDINSFKNKKFPSGVNAGCFVACIFNKIGLFDDKGNLSHNSALEKAKGIFNADEEVKNLEEFLNRCAKVNGEAVGDGVKGCERAKLAYNCLIENSLEFGFNIDF